MPAIASIIAAIYAAVTNTRDAAIFAAIAAYAPAKDTMAECPRCHGTGSLDEYSYNKGGVCFGCDGEGVTLTKITAHDRTRSAAIIETAIITATADEAREAEHAAYLAHIDAGGEPEPFDLIAFLTGGPK